MLHYTIAASDLYEWVIRISGKNVVEPQMNSLTQINMQMVSEHVWLSPAGDCLPQKSSTSVPRVLCSSGRHVREASSARVFNHHHLRNVPSNCSPKRFPENALPATLLPKTCLTRQQAVGKNVFSSSMRILRKHVVQIVGHERYAHPAALVL